MLAELLVPRLRPVVRDNFHDAGHGYDVLGLHPPTAERFLHALLPWYRRYFRVESTGIEYIPDVGGAILVANHGGVLPLDAAMLWADVNFRTYRFLRVVADRFVTQVPFVATASARAGAVSGTRSNVRLLLERDELLAIFPEGSSGPAKPSSHRYELQEWRVGHAELALEYGVPIIPVAIVGAEESWPIWKSVPLRMFGAPYFPLPRFPVPLPVRIQIHYGTPIMIDSQPGSDLPSNDASRVAALAARTRAAVVELLSRFRS